jgi:hypothetical protein
VFLLAQEQERFVGFDQLIHDGKMKEIHVEER